MMMRDIRELSIDAIEGDDNIDSLSNNDDEDEDDDKLSTKKTRKNKNKNRNKNKRRFSDEQVRSLESIFESETKLEPRKKVQVAKELGLQPRQVAIWFQNKRARWKSKQIEKNYRVLKSNYDNLKARLESLRKDKESLLIELQELRNRVNRPNENQSGCEDYVTNNQDNIEKHINNDTKLATKSSNLEEEMDHQGVGYSDDDKSGNNMAFLGQGEPEFLDTRENIDGSIVSQVKWCNFYATSLFDQSSSTSHWWDSWT
ncbi:hypothetical protein RND81_12G097700 [Saponaria officinalis]|uniref:Homeobox-leucine zipper protein n=1 Tax=Saponaria officinalis TaxID=3572 RepID=A0AAW1H8M8_SAPOF